MWDSSVLIWDGAPIHRSQVIKGFLGAAYQKASGSSNGRMMGSSVGAMLEVATGKAGLFFHSCLKPWQLASVSIILTEAGAIIRCIDGRETDFTSMDAVVGSSRLVEDFIIRVGKPFIKRAIEVQKAFLKKILDYLDGIRN